MAANVWLGAFVDGAWPNPGRKKDAGVIVCVPLIPPQPMPATRAMPVTNSRSIFQFIFTMAVWGLKIMRATIKSLESEGPSPPPSPRGRGGFRFRLKAGQHAVLGFCVAVLFLIANVVEGATDFVGEAEAAYQAARDNVATNSGDFKAQLKLAIAAFDFAEFAKSDDQREEIANVGIAASRKTVGLDPKSAAAHYYLALNLGQLARTKMLGALKLINEMVPEFKRSIELDQKFDYGGALRALGVLYNETPGWSIGSKTKARANMEKALELAPNYPDNYLTYMEALLKWKDRETLETKMAAYGELLPKAKKEFSGKEWEWEWTDWDKRWAALQAKGKRK